MDESARNANLLRDIQDLRRENERLAKELQERPSKHEVQELAQREARQMFQDLGFDMVHQGETASKVVWLMDLKPGARVMVMVILGGIVTMLAGLGVAYWGKALK